MEEERLVNFGKNSSPTLHCNGADSLVTEPHTKQKCSTKVKLTFIESISSVVHRVRPWNSFSMMAFLVGRTICIKKEQ